MFVAERSKPKLTQLHTQKQGPAGAVLFVAWDRGVGFGTDRLRGRERGREGERGRVVVVCWALGASLS